MVAIFALFLLVHNIISSRKKGQVLPLLQAESSGPYSSTRVSEGGVIIPTVVYLEQPGIEVEKAILGLTAKTH